MKNSILLKLLQSCHAKSTPNLPNTISQKGDKGFTLLEVLVIALILGILAAIAAPGWLGFINRQRVRTVNDRVFQSLRFAQSEAKRTKSDRVITFNPTDPPTFTINTVPAVTPPIQTVTFDAGGEIKPGTIALSAQANGDNAIRSITFDYQGNVTSPPIQSRTPRQITDGFIVTIAPANSPPNTPAKQCVIVETLIGAMRTAEGNDSVTGCP